MFIPAPSKSYNEIYQDTDLKYAFAVSTKDGLRQVHDFIKCRDFFNEAVVSSQIGCPCPSIYGFQYPSVEYPMSFKVTQLILKGEHLTQLQDQLHILNRYEADAGYAETCLEPIEGTDYLYLKASRIWTRSSVMISLYTHILRCLYQYKADTDDFLEFMSGCAGNQGNAAKYQAEINKIDLDTLLREAGTIFPEGCLPLDGMTEIEEIGHIHNNCGIVSWARAAGGSGVMGKYYSKSMETFKKLAA